MPFPNEHAARLRNPNDFSADSFRRTAGGTIYGRIKIPSSIGIIWGKLKGHNMPVPQSLRFKKDKWSTSEAKSFLKENKIKSIEFEPASDKSYTDSEDDDIKEIYFSEIEELIDSDYEDEDQLGCQPDTIKYKKVNFILNKFYDEKSDLGNFGYIEGYLSTFDKDRGGDEILPGAFKKTIKRHKKSNNRPIRMLFQHNRDNIIGGFPIDKVKEDDKGLWVVGQINLDVQKGAETYALAKQGVLSDMSIGYSVPSGGYDYDKNSQTNYLKEVELWEGSVVSEPMNTQAQILAVKTIEKFDCMKDIENYLKTTYNLSSSQRKILISKIKQFSNQRDVEEKDSQNELRDATVFDEKLDEIILNQKLDKCLSNFNNYKG